MRSQSRLDDNSRVPSDSHGNGCCKHSCIGPATTGSADVFVNGKPALRVTDQGIHSHCCGENTWQAVEGSETVLVNNLQAHRLGDRDQHCGGPGAMVEGSPDVMVGD